MSAKSPGGFFGRWAGPNTDGQAHASNQPILPELGDEMYCGSAGSPGGRNEQDGGQPAIFTSWGSLVSATSAASAPPGLNLPTAAEENDRLLRENELLRKQCDESTNYRLESENSRLAVENAMLKQQYFQASAVASAAAQASWNASYCANYGAYPLQHAASWGAPVPSPPNVWQQERPERKWSGHHEKGGPNAIDGGGKRPPGLAAAKASTLSSAHGVNASGDGRSPSGTLEEPGTPIALATAPAPMFLAQAQALANPLVVEERESFGAARVSWTVDAKRLRGNDKVIVSPPFDLPGRAAHAAFKMMIAPKVVSDAKGGASFKKARGKGGVQLKCEAELQDVGGASIVSFELSVGGTGPTATEGSVLADADQANSCLGRDPVIGSHDFSQSTLCIVQQVWNFAFVVDQGSQTFTVCLDVLPLEAE